MKKSITLMLIILLLMVNGGCSNTNVLLETTINSEDAPIDLEEIKHDDQQELTGEMNEEGKEMEEKMINIQFGEHKYTATLVNNTSTQALMEMLAEGPVTIDMRDYANMEKVGSIGKQLPRNDQQITAKAGDLILYQGDALVVYYESNSWNFTRIGKIDNITKDELKEVLGSGNVKVTLSLIQE